MGKGSDRNMQVAMEAQRRGVPPSLGEGCCQGRFPGGISKHHAWHIIGP